MDGGKEGRNKTCQTLLKKQTFTKASMKPEKNMLKFINMRPNFSPMPSWMIWVSLEEDGVGSRPGMEFAGKQASGHVTEDRYRERERERDKRQE